MQHGFLVGLRAVLASVVLGTTAIPAVAGGTPVLAQTAHECSHENTVMVAIDIRPGVYPNVVFLNGGLVPVALLSSGGLRRSRCRPRDGWPCTRWGAATRRSHLSAMPSTTWIGTVTLTLCSCFRPGNLTLTPGDTQACLHGSLTDGTHFCGTTRWWYSLDHLASDERTGGEESRRWTLPSLRSDSHHHRRTAPPPASRDSNAARWW